MTWVDAAIVVIFLYFIVTAFSAGLVRELIGMGATIAGVILAGLFYGDVADTLLSSIDNETTASVVGFLIVFLGITLAGQLVAMVVHPAITILQLGILDQLLGAAFGAVKAFLIIEVLLVLFVTYPRYHLDERINDSSFASQMLSTSKPITAILPEIFKHKVDAFNG
jgi:membrane protein required for colicin V production